MKLILSLFLTRTRVSFPLSGDGIAHRDVVAPAGLVHVGVGLVVGVTVRADNVSRHRDLRALIAGAGKKYVLSIFRSLL